MKRLSMFLGLLSLLLVGYLFLWPVPIEPVAWTPSPSTGYAGPHARNSRLAGVTEISVAPEVGPEHITFGRDGRLYTGVLSGAILRMNADGTDRETFVDTGGRPLGMEFDATGRLIVADALKGLLAVDPDGAFRVLADRVGDDPVRYADAVVIASDGRIYLTDASRRHSPAERGTFDAALLDILEHSCTGRVLVYEPSDGRLRLVIGGLCFPNGLALSVDQQSLLIAETGEYRVWKVDVAARDLDAQRIDAAAPPAAARVILDRLPGFPDNLTRDPDGRFWTGLTKPRSAVIDRAADKPWLRRIMLRLPKSLWPVPPSYGHVLAFDEDGKVLLDLQDPEGKVPETSGATAHGGRLYVQSLHGQALGVIDLGQVEP
ncbi:MAG TPA: SMP-30/gluconolactonase/LRE family protein [Steroidobacteraceae bacterium]|nr:SMP-30/gluconolactonase/LRE family protein [Steroidobacteraceae bacterium]